MVDVIEVTLQSDGTTTTVERNYTADEKAIRDAIAATEAQKMAEDGIAREKAVEKLAALGLTRDDLTALGL